MSKDTSIAAYVESMSDICRCCDWDGWQGFLMRGLSAGCVAVITNDGRFFVVSQQNTFYLSHWQAVHASDLRWGVW